MGYRRRGRYTDAEEALMWDRWQKGDSMNEIGRWLGIQARGALKREL